MSLPRLLVLSPGTLRDPHDPGFEARLTAALAAGLAGLVLREPLLPDGAWLALGRRVRRLGPASTLWLAVHDRVHLAQALEAQAVHLGFRSLAPAAVRAGFGEGLRIGLSTHADDDPSRWSGADHLFHGPLRPTPSKPPGSPGHRPPVGEAGLARAVGMAGVPVFALGGVRPEDVPAVRAAGAWGVVVLSGILGAPEPGAAVAAYLDALRAT